MAGSVQVIILIVGAIGPADREFIGMGAVAELFVARARLIHSVASLFRIDQPQHHAIHPLTG